MTLTLSPVGREALDDPGTDPALVARMLDDITACNRWLGGAAAAWHGIAQLLDAADRGRTLTLFDIGTGAADLPRDARRRAASRGVVLVPLGLERIPAAARVAAAHGVPVMLGCAGALPLRRQSVDIVLVSQVLHHLDRTSAGALLAECSATARRGVVIADLHRRWFAAPGFRAAGVALRLHPTTIADGITSLERGYTRDSLAALCANAGAPHARIAARLGARIVAWWRTDAH